MKPEDITEEALSAQMYTAGQKDPDFILRPSGEKRLSNFMLWQAAYSELVEMDVLWPDFTRDDLDAAIMEFKPAFPPLRRTLSAANDTQDAARCARPPESVRYFLRR